MILSFSLLFPHFKINTLVICSESLPNLKNNSENSCLLSMQTSEHQKKPFFPTANKPKQYLNAGSLIYHDTEQFVFKVEMGGQG